MKMKMRASMKMAARASSYVTCRQAGTHTLANVYRPILLLLLPADCLPGIVWFYLLYQHTQTRVDYTNIPSNQSGLQTSRDPVVAAASGWVPGMTTALRE
jgi:hypothetical protein